MKNYQDFCQAISQQLFEIIDNQGSLLSWHKTWESRGSQALPTGANGSYHGANLFHLLFAQFKQGLQSNHWLTFNQINQRGGQVKKGTKSQKVFFWKLKTITETVEKNQDISNNELVEKQKTIFKVYSVFNLEQTTLDEPINITNPNHPNQESIDKLIKTLKVEVSHHGNRAFYESSDDVIVLPKPDLFRSKANYYATLLHELVGRSTYSEKSFIR